MAQRFTSSGACVECSALSNKRFAASNPDKGKSYNAKHRAKNPDKHRASVNAWAERNRDSERERARIKNAANRDYYREKNREWYASNKAWSAAKANWRKVMKTHATPIWADEDKIMAFYLEAERLTHETGVPHHVDHIFPLIGETSCGLHVETNLQVIPQRENLEKHNKLPLYDYIDDQLVVFLSQ